MSALVLFTSGGKSYVATDAGGFFAGRLMTLQTKTTPLPHLGIAVGLRGVVGVLRRVAWELQNLPGPEALADVLPRRLKAAFGWKVRLWPSRYHFDCGVAGHDDNGPYLALISSISRPGHPAFTLQRLDGLWLSPVIGEADQRRLLPMIAREPDAAAVGILDAMRRDGEVQVGGYGQLTAVGPHGITTRLLKRWPDKVGQRIDPATGLTPVRPAGLVANWR